MFDSSFSAHVILDHLLAVLDIGVTHFTLCDIRNGWGMRFEPSRTASLHYCLAGAGSLAVRGLPAIPLEPHRFVLLPPGVDYCLESVPSAPIRLESRARVRGVQSQEPVPRLTVGDGQDRKSVV